VKRFLGGALLLTAAVLLAVRVVILDSDPWLEPYDGSGQQLASRTRQILENGTTLTDNRGTHLVMRLTAEDLETSSLFLITSKHWRGRTLAAFSGPHLDVRISLSLPWMLGNYVNARVSLLDHDPIAKVEEVRVGRITLSGAWLHDLIPNLIQHGLFGKYQIAGIGGLESMRVNHHHLGLTVDWMRGAERKAQSLASSPADLERVLAYRTALNELAGREPQKTTMELTDALVTLFTLAQQRSAINGNTALDENSALIQTLSAYTNGYDILNGQNPPVPAMREVRLRGRHDLAQHFMTSAALGIAGDRDIADIVGVAKEMSDSHGGSGFSFMDLAADRAGARLGHLAARSERNAISAQQKMTLVISEDAYMPTLENLPENLSQSQFQQHYDSVLSSEFSRMTQDIDHRIQALSLYQ
jgi:hypothetical protein